MCVSPFIPGRVAKNGGKLVTNQCHIISIWNNSHVTTQLVGEWRFHELDFLPGQGKSYSIEAVQAMAGLGGVPRLTLGKDRVVFPCPADRVTKPYAASQADPAAYSRLPLLGSVSFGEEVRFDMAPPTQVGG
jgi:hypothetical protein